MTSFLQRFTDDPSWTDAEWVYQPPTGGAGSPYRLGDFRGYNHNALGPVDIPGSVLEKFYSTSGTVIDVNFDPFANGSSKPLGVNDFNYYGSFYLAVLCKRISNGTYYIKTASKKFSEYTNTEMASLTITASELGNYSYNYWIVGCNNKWTTFSSPTNLGDATTSFISLPSSMPKYARGTVTYTTAPLRGNVTIWGIDCIYENSLSTSLADITTTYSGYKQVGLLDYQYNLRIGFSVGASGGSFTFYKGGVLAKVAKQFGGSSVSSYAQVLYEVNTNKPNTNFSSIKEIGTEAITVAQNATRHFVLDVYNPDFMSSPKTHGTVTTGQTITTNLTVSAGAASKVQSITISN